MSLRAAIQALQVEVNDFRHGTPNAPKEGTQDWWLLRAKMLALSTLKRADQIALEGNPAGGERFFAACGRQLKHEVE